MKRTQMSLAKVPNLRQAGKAFLALTALLLLASAALRQAQDVALAQGDYDLSWFTMDGDGGTAKAAATSRAAPSASRTQGSPSPVVTIPSAFTPEGISDESLPHTIPRRVGCPRDGAVSDGGLTLPQASP